MHMLLCRCCQRVKLYQFSVYVEMLQVLQPIKDQVITTLDTTVETLPHVWVVGARRSGWRRWQQAMQNVKICVYTAMSQDCVSHCCNSMPFVAVCEYGCVHLNLPVLSVLDYVSANKWMRD